MRQDNVRRGTERAQINEQHPHGGDWLREIVFGRERWPGYDARIYHGAERSRSRTVTPGRAWGDNGGRDFDGPGGHLSARTTKQILD
jgi:VIT1/CCC1 family predicted Fe2+/Mn2+ transporter